MGLDALPDELPTVRPRKSLQEMPTYGCAKQAEGSPVLFRQHSHGAIPFSWKRPPLSQDAQREQTNEGVEESELAPVLPFRDHPQEEQLLEFKREFETKERERARNTQLDDMSRQLEEKKNKVRATLDKARIALSQGIITEPKHHLNGQGKFEESQEFLDAMEFLQCNKDFIFQFLQQKPHVMFSNEPRNTIPPVIRPKTPKKGKRTSAATPRDSTEKKRDGFSPRAIARLFMPSDSRKRNEREEQLATPPSGTGSLPAIVRCNSSRMANTGSRELSGGAKLKTSSSTNSRNASPTVTPKVHRDDIRSCSKNGAQDVIGEIKERLRQRDADKGAAGEEVRFTKDFSKEHLRGSVRDSKGIAPDIVKNAREGLNFQKLAKDSTQTRIVSTGKRISMQKPDTMDMACMSDGEDIPTPLQKVFRGNVGRSCVSLPSPPHLLAPLAKEAAAGTRVTRNRALKKTLNPKSGDSIDTPATPRAADRTIAKKTLLALKSPRRSSPRSSTEVEKNPMRRSASVNENCVQGNAFKPKGDSLVVIARKNHLHGANEPSTNLTRCRSLPNSAILREKGQHAKETACKPTKTTAEVVSTPAKHHQSGEKKKGLLIPGRKKWRDSSEVMPLTPDPVLARVVSLAESCVSRSNTLSDADSAADALFHVRSSRNSLKKSKEKPREIMLPPKPVTYAEFLQHFRASPPTDESVISESSADSDLGPYEHEFLEVLTLMNPLAKRKSTAATQTAPMQRVQSPACPPSPQSRKVQNAKNSPQPLRTRATARKTLHHHIEESSQDSSSDKNGQPSPVSVLDLPFESEESLSPLEFKEITNDLRELQNRLRLLKADGSDPRMRDSMENVVEMAVARVPGDKQRGALRDLACKSRQERNGRLKSYPHPVDPEADFAFVRDILVTSGFHTCGGRNISRWHSSTQPISPRLCERIEANYSDTKQGRSMLRILFHAINEILVARLESQSHHHLRLQATGSLHVEIPPRTMTTGRRFVEDIWNDIRLRQFPALCPDPHHDYLESLVVQDLKFSSSWLSLHDDVDRICLKLERAIFDDLMQELCVAMLV
ncbi:uncharacterized protein [Physcomitrium patens]|nr:uncharacterized protein LOC112292156 isoform X2 [Physcomitrium patens]|eukprot:XP_024396119.1 uncharacterized protein LOC112292156 isoform X2 [Physcomitrella patens]